MTFAELQRAWFDEYTNRRPDLAEPKRWQMAFEAAKRGDMPPAAPPAPDSIDIRKTVEDEFQLSYLDEAQLAIGWRIVRKMIPHMRELYRSLMDDRTFAVRVIRALLAWFALELGRGSIPILNGPKSYWIAPLVLSFSQLFGAGERNAPPGDIRTIALDSTISPTPRDKMQPPGL